MTIIRNGLDMGNVQVDENLECANFGFCCRGAFCL